MSKTLGQLVRVNSKKVRGWAFRPGLDQPLSVDLFINNKKLYSSSANQFREGLVINNTHPTGEVGFHFSLEDTQLNDGDIITVSSQGETLDIVNNPYEYRSIDKRILVVGLPKSGTSICTYKIKDALPEYCKLHFEPESKLGLNKPHLHFKMTLDPCVVTKNLFIIGEGKKVKLTRIQKFYDKKIWIYRDPRDLLISTFFYRWNFSHKPDKQEFKESLEVIKKKEKKPNDIPFHTAYVRGRPEKMIERKYEAMFSMFETLNKNWHYLKYEDLVDDTVDNLEQYLGFNINKEANVAVHLKRVERSKTYGSWRKWFTKEDVDLFKPILTPILKKLNYDHKDWDLEKVRSLPSNEGSIYMSKLFHGKFKKTETFLGRLFNFNKD